MDRARVWIAMILAFGLSTTLCAETMCDDADARALATLKEHIDDFKARADEHEVYAVGLTTARFILEGISTVFLAMGENPIYNKKLPLVAMGLSRVFEQWLKYRKSDEKWPNLRKKQREFEGLRMLYTNQATVEFQGPNRAQILVTRIAAIANDAHGEWAGLTKQGRQETASKSAEPATPLQSTAAPVPSPN